MKNIVEELNNQPYVRDLRETVRFEVSKVHKRIEVYIQHTLQVNKGKNIDERRQELKNELKKANAHFDKCLNELTEKTVASLSKCTKKIYKIISPSHYSKFGRFL